MDVFDLAARITLNSTQYDKGLDDAQKKTSSFGQKLKSGLSTAAKVGAVTLGATAAAATGLAVALVKGASDVASYGDNIDKMSQKMNMSAQAFQEWDFIMQHNGTSIESMQASIKTLSNAAETNSKAFEQLGITQEQIASMNGEELFSATITALQGVEDETQRTYLAGKLLGRGATELGALLNMSAEETEAMRQSVHDLGGVMSDEAVKAAAAFQDNLQDMKTSFEGIKRGILADLLPSFSGLMQGLTQVFSGDSDKGIAMIGNAVGDLATKLVNAVPKILQTALGIVKSLASVLLQNIPMIISAVLEIARSIVSTLLENSDEIISAAQTIVMTLVSGLTQNLPKIIQMAAIIIAKLAGGLGEFLPQLVPSVIQMLLSIVDALVSNIGIIVDGALKLVTGLAQGIIKALPVLLKQAPVVIKKLIETLLSKLPLVIQSAGEIVKGLLTGILQALPDLLREIPTLVISIVNTLLDLVPMIIDVGTELLGTLLDNSEDIIGTWADALPDLITGLVDSILSHLPAIIMAGYNLLKALFTKIPDVLKYYFGVAFPTFWGKIWDYLKGLAGKMQDIGKEWLTKLGDGIKANVIKVIIKIVEMWNSIKEKFNSLLSKAVNWGKDLIDNFVNGIKNKINKVKETVSNVASTIKRILGFSEPDEGPLANFHTFAPDMIDLWNKGITDNEDDLKKTIEDAFNFAPTIEGATKVNYTASGSSSSGGLSEAIAAALKNTKIAVVIDGRKTVGYLAPNINATLGDLNTMEGRGLCLT